MNSIVGKDHVRAPRPRKRKKIAVGGVAAASLIMFASCGSSSKSASSSATTAPAVSGGTAAPTTVYSGPTVNLTFWSWVPGIAASVNLWNQTHPNIHVTLDEVTSGAAGTYAKMFSSLQAGNAPDLGQVEYYALPQFEHTGGLMNIAPYGAASVQSDFVPWTWSQVTLGSAVYAIPQDTGPMALFYRADLFKKYGLTVPTTWAQYQADAQKLHAANPNAYIGAFSPADTGQFAGLAWQAGANWFNTTSNSWVVNINDAATQKVANYWQNLVSNHLVKVEADFANGWYKDLSDGTLLTWPSAVWGENTIVTNAASTSGDWSVAPLPNWGSTSADGNWGGSTTVVFKDSKHPAQATQFAEWLNTNQQSITSLITKGGLYPADLTGEQQSAVNSPVAFYGNQNIWSVFESGGKLVNTSFKWGPIMFTTLTDMGNAFSKATGGSGTLASSIATTQSQTVSAMKSQGFSVQTAG